MLRLNNPISGHAWSEPRLAALITLHFGRRKFAVNRLSHPEFFLGDGCVTESLLLPCRAGAARNLSRARGCDQRRIARTPERWKKLDALFHSALELKGEARAAHLANVYGDDE